MPPLEGITEDASKMEEVDYSPTENLVCPDLCKILFFIFFKTKKKIFKTKPAYILDDFVKLLKSTWLHLSINIQTSNPICLNLLGLGGL